VTATAWSYGERVFLVLNAMVKSALGLW